MAVYQCKNLGGSCSRADAGEEFTLAAGGDDKCPECGSTLVQVGAHGVDAQRGKRGIGAKPKWLLPVAGVLALGLVGFGYSQWSGSQVVILKPGPDAVAAAPVVAAMAAPVSAATAAIAAVPSVTAPVVPDRPAAMASLETAARTSCEEATKAKRPDADKVCRRASAVTLMNSGVLAAIDGKLDAAEKDYLAAKEKDPDFPELYFNLAVLKARQEKGSEALDNLTLASAKGFKQFSAIKAEPALQKLKADQALKARLEAFEAR